MRVTELKELKIFFAGFLKELLFPLTEYAFLSR